MVPTHWKQFITCLMLLLFTENVELQDPCNDAKILGNLHQRLIGYTLGTTETMLSDFRLTPGWYRLHDDMTLATKPTPCGTYVNWWLKDPLPTKGDSSVRICQNDGNNDCSMTRRITVVKCPNGYAYQLDPTESDMEAYCIESVENGGNKPVQDDAPDISGLTPTISAAVHKVGNKNALEFYCDFTVESKNLIYDVEWNLHSGASKVSSIRSVQLISYENQQKFRDKTKLTEKDLTDSLVSRPGFTLVCAVMARKSVLGLPSSTKDSPPKFCGIRILTPSVIRVKKDETVDIKLELTIPFGCIRPGCTLELNMLVPSKKGKLKNCLLSDIAQNIPFEGRHCGVKFQNAGDIATFTVAASFGNNFANPTSRVYELAFSSHKKNLNHPFFASYKLPSITIELLVDQSPLQNKICFSVSDPHMQTFDGMAYENQNLGTFILYRHKKLEAEVQMKTAACNNNNRAPYCNCGVAVRAGKDIFLINNCAGQVQPPRIVYCKDSVFYRQITRNGATYEIILPHGTKVTLTLNGRFVNVHIYPSLVDERKTRGLCGLFDNSPYGDQQPRRGGENFIDSWRVLPNEDLFLQTNYGKVKGWIEKLLFCDCSHSNSNGFFENTKCSSQRKCTIKPDASTLPRQDMCDHNTRRKKRDAGGIIFDTYTDPTTAFYSTDRTKDTLIEHNLRSKRQVSYNNVTARAECLRMMNTSTFQKCDAIPNLDIDTMVENCKLDAVMTSTMDWTMSHLESIKQTCIEHVEVMQPLPPEVRAELVVLPEENSTDENNGTHEYPTLPPPTMSSSGVNPISAELLQDIKTHSCPNECQGHGKCENGKCKCDEPFSSFDCSIDITQPPIMTGIPDKGECDLQQRRCAETAVFGTNFAETPSLSCRLKQFMVDKNNMIRYGQSVDVLGKFESMFEVYCPFPESRRKRSVPNDVSNDDIAQGYHTSVSNDGKSYSQGDTIVIYDSQCVNCSKVQDKIICIKESGYCVKHGRCYLPGEPSGCYTCADEGGSHVEWSAGPDCNVAKPQTMKGWMIGVIAVACAVVFIVVIAVLCIIWNRKKASRREIDTSMSSLRNTYPDKLQNDTNQQ